MKDSFHSSKEKMIEKPDPDMDVGYEGIAGEFCQFTGVKEDFEIIFNAVGGGKYESCKGLF
ncbi:hypothetical protein MNBD_GAMMA18-911 [hydrothermal vent metagenome]|uniref:Uncharacterized protein n=1 Tax=hydrothermal vent metagenome TaxID=652676 RepID=A0A3B0ZX92_9ZZZZ